MKEYEKAKKKALLRMDNVLCFVWLFNACVSEHTGQYSLLISVEVVTVWHIKCGIELTI